MKTTFCTWSVRGLGREDRRWAVKDLLQRRKIYVISLQETKLQTINRRIVVDLWGRSFEFVHKPMVGRADGILVAWDSSVIEVVDQFVGDFSVSILVRSREEGCCWAFSGVYDPSEVGRFPAFREKLGGIRIKWGYRGVLGVTSMQSGTRRNS